MAAIPLGLAVQAAQVARNGFDELRLRTHRRELGDGLLERGVGQKAQFERYRRPTRCDAFLATKRRIVPWAELCGVSEPLYPKPGNGRPAAGLERMLRRYLVQHRSNPADEACEDALPGSTALRRLMGIDSGRERVPGATTLLKSRRLLERRPLGEALFAEVDGVLQARGLKMAPARSWMPRSSGHPARRRTPPRHATPRCIGPSRAAHGTTAMEPHIGVDSETGLAHSPVVTAADVHDKRPVSRAAARARTARPR